MTGKLKELAYNRDGKQVLTIILDGDFREQFDELEPDQVTIDIRKWHRRRSMNANAYAWVLIDKLAERTGITKQEVYRIAIRDIGGVSDVVCIQTKALEAFRSGWEMKGLGWQTEVLDSKLVGCTNVVVYYGSSVYDTRQMSQLIDVLVNECKAQGIETLSPDELEKLAGYARFYA